MITDSTSFVDCEPSDESSKNTLLFWPPTYFLKLHTPPLFINFQRATLASSSVSTACPPSKDILWTLNCKSISCTYKLHVLVEEIEIFTLYSSRTCAPWRTRISIPLLSIDIRAASSTSLSADSSSFRGFENITFNSYSMSVGNMPKKIKRKGKTEGK